MHEVLKTLTRHPTQKCYKISWILKTPQKFFKNQNLGQKRMECVIKEWERIISDEEHWIWVEDQVRNVRGLRVREERICRERLKEMSEKSRWLLFIEIS